MSEPAAPSPAVILVVDDNEANRSLVRHTLEDEGYRVVVASGGAEAIAAFQREPIDCIVLDVRMPEMDGFTVCERVRQLAHGPETPVIFLTALRDVETFDRALRAGGDDFLTKPVRPTELLARVETALELRRMRVELRAHYMLLKRQRDDLQRLQLQKERLMAFVVHDLKNPVSAIDLHAQVLLHTHGLPESARESASHIRVEGRQLIRMILNLLDISKADEGQLSPMPKDVDLGALINEVFSELRVNAEARRVQLRCSIAHEQIYVDEDLIRRTVTNLVENATRYAPAGSVIQVTATPVDDAVELRVADAGSGIQVDMRQKIFDPFVQAAAGEHPVGRGGRGLGLTFCKLAVEAHGGRIWVEDSAPGAVFCVRLPRGR